MSAGYTIAAFVSVAAGAMAQQKSQPIACGDAGLTIRIASPVCERQADVAVTVDRVPGTGPMAKGAVKIEGQLESGSFLAFVNVADLPDMGIVPPPAKDVPTQIHEATAGFRTGELSPLRTIGNAWVMTFPAGSDTCLWFDNYGPAQADGYAWSVEGYYCRAAASITDTDIQKALSAVLPRVKR